MTETVNYINFEKCKMPKRDEAMINFLHSTY